jgi:hypothetical protein
MLGWFVHVCCNRLILMFHLFFSDICCKCVYLDIAYLLYICCNCFICMLCMYCNNFHVFSRVFASILDVCLKCFIYLLLYVTSIASVCFKSRLCLYIRWRGKHEGVRAVAMRPRIAGRTCTQKQALAGDSKRREASRGHAKIETQHTVAADVRPEVLTLAPRTHGPPIPLLSQA